MASTIKIKRSGVSGKQPNTATLSVGELAINYKDQKLYSSNGTAVFQIGASSGSSGLVSITTATVKNLTQNDTVVTNVGVVAANSYLQVANAVATYQTKAVERAALANTNSRINLINTNLTNTNTAIRTLVSDRLQVANAAATYLTKNNPVITGTLTANGSTGTAGYYLRTSGTGVYWSPAAAGTGGSSGGTTANVVTKTLDSLKGTDTVVTSVSGVVINSGITTGKAIAMAIVFGG